MGEKMKRVISFLIVFIMFFSAIVFTQTEEMNCITNYTETNWNGQIGGLYLPAEGTIKVLLVFAQFPDDNHDVNNISWTKNQAPADMNNWVDETWSANATTGYLTDYFNDMSFNKLKFIGKEVFRVSPHSRQWYFDNYKNRGFIHKEIIQSLDSTWDFAEFDNWDYNGNYIHVNQPDGVVEMIVFIWRNIAHDLAEPGLYYQRLDMGRYGSIGGPDFTVDNGLRTVKTGFGGYGSTPYGSGATLTDWFSEDMFRFVIHEFGHYL
jgi:hypothetical protein